MFRVYFLVVPTSARALARHVAFCAPPRYRVVGHNRYAIFGRKDRHQGSGNRVAAAPSFGMRDFCSDAPVLLRRSSKNDG